MSTPTKHERITYMVYLQAYWDSSSGGKLIVGWGKQKRPLIKRSRFNNFYGGPWRTRTSDLVNVNDAL